MPSSFLEMFWGRRFSHPLKDIPRLKALESGELNPPAPLRSNANAINKCNAEILNGKSLEWWGACCFEPKDGGALPAGCPAQGRSALCPHLPGQFGVILGKHNHNSAPHCLLTVNARTPDAGVLLPVLCTIN